MELEPAGFVAAQLPLIHILAVYGSASVFVVSIIWKLSGKLKSLTKVDRALMCWFAFSGLTHMILEGYYVFTPEFYKIKGVHFLAEVWKEYNNGDARYAARDAGVVMVEGITSVLEGPACLLAVFAIATKKPSRYTLQLAVSLGQLYGDLVYFGMPVLEGKEVSKPGALYYWFYYIFMNNIWVVIPLLIVLRSWLMISAAVSSSSRTIEVKAKTAMDKRRAKAF